MGRSRGTRSALGALLALAALTAPARAQGDAEVKAALDRGVTYLKGRQDPATGAWQDRWAEKNYPMGETALSLLALLKAGVPPDAPEIAKGFDWLLQQPTKTTYEVSSAVLALEARYAPEEKASIDDEEPLAAQIRKRFQKLASGRDRRWLAAASEFLIKHQNPGGLWRYPFYGDPDLSNSQFAILALKAAGRMGVAVPPETYLSEATCLIGLQEQDGPPVASFEVPAADLSIKGLLDKREKDRRRRPRGEKRERDGETRTREGGNAPESATQVRMKARGFGYKPGAAARGSMTAAGLAVLVACKSELEGVKGYDRELGPKVDQAIRDAAGWLATRFAVDKNPGADPDWLFYYLYTLERAGTLMALRHLGAHDWYAEGARLILGKQAADGAFRGGLSGESDGDVAGTCFAMLFLKRSTVPVLKRVMTGGDSGPGAGAPNAGAATTVTRRDDGQLEVTFRFRAAPGQQVTVAGSFNGWNKSAQALADPDGDGTFEATLTLPAGRHQYKFVVDGNQWLQDPSNQRGEPDGHGGQNSVIEG